MDANISWTTLEFEPKDRHPDWNWYAGLVAGIGAAIAIFYGDLFFGIFLIIAGIVVIIYAIRPPRHLQIRIAKEGIFINDELVPNVTISQFWLDETDKQDKLLLLIKGSFVPTLSLRLEGVNAEAVRNALKGNQIPEVEMHESRSIKIFEYLGF
jgi:hypothetical protein